MDLIDKSYIPMNEVVGRMSKSHIDQENFYMLSHQINQILFLMDISKTSIEFVCINFSFYF